MTPLLRRSAIGTLLGGAFVHRRAQTTDPDLEIAHLGVACSTRAELERQCAVAAAEGCLREPLRETGSPAGCLAMLSDPDGHTLELSHGQKIGIAVGSFKGEDA